VSNALNEDINLIIRFKDGDLSAFEEFVHKNEDRIYNLCRYMLHHSQDAQDAAQDTFIKAYKGLQGFHPDASLSTWLYRIAVNTCLDHQKKSRHDPLEGEVLSEELLSFEPSPEDQYKSKKTTEAIRIALQKLPEKLKSVLVLREIEELTYEEIALVLDTSVGTVKSRISRAREELRVLFHGKL
jgi:RNA polymerase sigma-70 factor (ECF subfamily)